MIDQVLKQRSVKTRDKRMSSGDISKHGMTKERELYWRIGIEIEERASLWTKSRPSGSKQTCCISEMLLILALGYGAVFKRCFSAYAYTCKQNRPLRLIPDCTICVIAEGLQGLNSNGCLCRPTYDAAPPLQKKVHRSGKKCQFYTAADNCFSGKDSAIIMYNNKI